ncbi:DUF4232 domain-containing protein [Streptacidiphilus sp. EB129]|uniref:DUF4232 domain-containing protein n=1 Tax=Streptacidiphilus sp. EB129 TaxID=3156262 RepID=UPI003512B2C7
MTVRHRTLPLALLAAATAVLATACSGGAATSASGSAPSSAVTSGASGGASTASTGGSGSGGGAQTAAPISNGGSNGGSGSGSNGGSAGGSGGSAGGNGSSDSYAYKHPCTSDQVTVAVRYQASVGTTRRVITVTNHGGSACGMSYYPDVSIGANASAATSGDGTMPGSLTAKAPGGLGGAPYDPLYAGQTQYSVVDLNPGHSSAGTSRSYDTLAVRADDSWANAVIQNDPVRAQPANSGNPEVKDPRVSLYYTSLGTATAQVAVSGNYA